MKDREKMELKLEILNDMHKAFQAGADHVGGPDNVAMRHAMQSLEQQAADIKAEMDQMDEEAEATVEAEAEMMLAASE